MSSGVTCDFESDFCGWRNGNSSGVYWIDFEVCLKTFLWFWCREENKFMQLNLSSAYTDNMGVLQTTWLTPTQGIGCCHLGFFNGYAGDASACQLSVQYVTLSDPVREWNIPLEATAERHKIPSCLPCSEKSYQIRFVGRKLHEGQCILAIDDIQYEFVEGFRKVSTTISTLLSTDAGGRQPSLENITHTHGGSSGEDEGGFELGPLVVIVGIAIVLMIVAVVIIALAVLRRRKLAQGETNQQTSLSPRGQKTTDKDGRMSGGLQMMPVGGSVTSSPDHTRDNPDSANVYTTPEGSGGDGNYDVAATSTSRSAAQAANIQGNYNRIDLKGPGLAPSTSRADDTYDHAQAPKEIIGRTVQDVYAVPHADRKRRQQHGDGHPVLQNAGAGTANYEVVDGDGKPMTSAGVSHDDVYNKLDIGGESKMGQEAKQENHYDHFTDSSGTGDEYNRLDRGDKAREQQREVIKDEYSHV